MLAEYFSAMPYWQAVWEILSNNCTGGGAKVYIDDGGIIFDASLNQTNIGGNNNKVGTSFMVAPVSLLTLF